MKLINNYIKNFLSRAGGYVFLATVFARLFAFLASWIALKLIDNTELGVVIFALNIILFFIPLGGLGLHQSLVRFGALQTSNKEKDNLFIYTLKKGLIASFFIVIAIIIGSYFFNYSFQKTQYYIIILSFLIIPMYVFELIKIQFRLKHNNKLFATSELVYSLIQTLLVLFLSFFYKEKGYVFALLLAPIFTIILFFKRLNISFKDYTPSKHISLYFYKYGFFASLSNVATQLLFVVDIFLIGYLLKDAEMVTNYRYISIIPFSILFLPRVFMATDFVAFTEKIYDKNYIQKYSKGYVTFFLLVSILLVVICYFFSEQILLMFGNNFVSYADSFFILIVGICGILIFRGLYGNLLSSIGKAHINYYIASVALVLNVATNYYLIPIYGIKGAAITSAFLMWLTGIITYACFLFFYKKLPLK